MVTDVLSDTSYDATVKWDKVAIMFVCLFLKQSRGEVDLTV